MRTSPNENDRAQLEELTERSLAKHTPPRMYVCV